MTRWTIVFVLFCLSITLNAQEQKKSHPVKVACVGNSITYGAAIKNKLRDSYPAVLGQMLGRDYDVRNFGVSGTTLLRHGDMPYIKQPAYRAALDFQPNVVIIKLGTNDSKPQNWKLKDDFRNDLIALVDTFRSLPSKPEIYLCYPCTAYRTEGINETVIKEGVMPIIREVAEAKDIKLIDLHTPTAGKKEYFPDTVHPNEEGAVILAETVYEALTGKKTKHQRQAFPGFKSKWYEGDKYDFEYEGRKAIVVKPLKSHPGKPWIWRPAFFGSFATADRELLRQGFHIVYYDLTHEYGNPKAVESGTKFYKYLVDNYSLSPKAILEGLSRGGFMALNWAIKNADKVACIYVDAPVCDLFSWPGRKRPELWQDMLAKWHLTDEQMEHFSGNPIDNLKPLAERNIPILLICGDSDRTVPYAENGKILHERYQALDAPIELILKKGCDHHPHSLKDPKEIVKFIMKYIQK